MTLNEQFATAFGIGRAPHAPGTAASFAAVLIAIPVMYFTGWIGIGVLALATFAAGVYFSDLYGQETGNTDPGECVIDEFAGQWFACAVGGLAAMPGQPALSIAGFFLAFVLFRLFDIAKPWPVSKAENLPGGLGIMADDVVAGLIAGFVVFLVAYSGFI